MTPENKLEVGRCMVLNSTVIPFLLWGGAPELLAGRAPHSQLRLEDNYLLVGKEAGCMIWQNVGATFI